MNRDIETQDYILKHRHGTLESAIPKFIRVRQDPPKSRQMVK